MAWTVQSRGLEFVRYTGERGKHGFLFRIRNIRELRVPDSPDHFCRDADGGCARLDVFDDDGARADHSPRADGHADRLRNNTMNDRLENRSLKYYHFPAVHTTFDGQLQVGNTLQDCISSARVENRGGNLKNQT